MPDDLGASRRRVTMKFGFTVARAAETKQACYITLYTLILNLVIVILVTPLMNTLGAKPQDQTAAADYYA